MRLFIAQGPADIMNTPKMNLSLSTPPEKPLSREKEKDDDGIKKKKHILIVLISIPFMWLITLSFIQVI